MSATSRSYVPLSEGRARQLAAEGRTEELAALRAECDRIERQGEIARAIRSAIHPLRGRRVYERLRDRALLIETARTDAEADALLKEVRSLGLEIEERP